MDAFTQRRVSELRNEITALQDQNQTYHIQESHTQAESDQQEVRRLPSPVNQRRTSQNDWSIPKPQAIEHLKVHLQDSLTFARRVSLANPSFILHTDALQSGAPRIFPGLSHA